MSKYEPLRHFLKARKAKTVPMTFAEIEQVLGFKLPKSKMYPAWWSNNATNNVMTNEWLAAGFKTEKVDIAGKTLVFRRTEPAPGADTDEPAAAGKKPAKKRRRHPLFGWMKGSVTIAPGTDLTLPADPDWGRIAWGDDDPEKPRRADPT